MKPYKKVTIVRTALIALVAALAGVFAYAVYDDRATGTLLDEQGIIERDDI